MSSNADPRVRLALNKAVASLRSFGIQQPIAKMSEDGRSGYIAIDLEDLGRAIEKKLLKKISKDLPRGVKVAVTVKNGMLGVLVERSNTLPKKNGGK